MKHTERLRGALNDLNYVQQWAKLDAAEMRSISSAIKKITEVTEWSRLRTRVVSFEHESASSLATLATDYCQLLEERGGEVLSVHVCVSPVSIDHDQPQILGPQYAIFIVCRDAIRGEQT